jgi:GNAT superfamily N-acetyltransferase
MVWIILMITLDKFEVKPVDNTNWPDLEKLFESKGAPHHCWCMVWRASAEEKKQTDKQQRKGLLKLRVDAQIPVGLLAYFNDEPIAWCSVAPRDTFRDLGGEQTLQRVWSLVCFYIRREYRGEGLTTKLINEAKEYARKNGAEFLEAYPVDSDSPSYRFMGFRSAFEKNGFKFVKKAGKRRRVMISRL